MTWEKNELKLYQDTILVANKSAPGIAPVIPSTTGVLKLGSVAKLDENDQEDQIDFGMTGFIDDAYVIYN